MVNRFRILYHSSRDLYQDVFSFSIFSFFKYTTWWHTANYQNCKIQSNTPVPFHINSQCWSLTITHLVNVPVVGGGVDALPFEASLQLLHIPDPHGATHDLPHVGHQQVHLQVNTHTITEAHLRQCFLFLSLSLFFFFFSRIDWDPVKFIMQNSSINRFKQLNRERQPNRDMLQQAHSVSSASLGQRQYKCQSKQAL